MRIITSTASSASHAVTAFGSAAAHRAVQRVARLGPVDRDRRDAVGDIDQHLVRHLVPSCPSGRRRPRAVLCHDDPRPVRPHRPHRHRHRRGQGHRRRVRRRAGRSRRRRRARGPHRVRPRRRRRAGPGRSAAGRSPCPPTSPTPTSSRALVDPRARRARPRRRPRQQRGRLGPAADHGDEPPQRGGRVQVQRARRVHAHPALRAAHGGGRRRAAWSTSRRAPRAWCSRASSPTRPRRPRCR